MIRRRRRTHGKALRDAAADGDAFAVESILCDFPDAHEICDKWGFCALHEAAMWGREDVVQLLLLHVL